MEVHHIIWADINSRRSKWRYRVRVNKNQDGLFNILFELFGLVVNFPVFLAKLKRHESWYVCRGLPYGIIHDIFPNLPVAYLTFWHLFWSNFYTNTKLHTTSTHDTREYTVNDLHNSCTSCFLRMCIAWFQTAYHLSTDWLVKLHFHWWKVQEEKKHFMLTLRKS